MWRRSRALKEISAGFFGSQRRLPDLMEHVTLVGLGKGPARVFFVRDGVWGERRNGMAPFHFDPATLH